MAGGKKPELTDFLGGSGDGDYTVRSFNGYGSFTETSRHDLADALQDGSARNSDFDIVGLGAKVAGFGVEIGWANDYEDSWGWDLLPNVEFFYPGKGGKVNLVEVGASAVGLTVGAGLGLWAESNDFGDTRGGLLISLDYGYGNWSGYGNTFSDDSWFDGKLEASSPQGGYGGSGQTVVYTNPENGKVIGREVFVTGQTGYHAMYSVVNFGNGLQEGVFPIGFAGRSGFELNGLDMLSEIDAIRGIEVIQPDNWYDPTRNSFGDGDSSNDNDWRRDEDSPPIRTTKIDPVELWGRDSDDGGPVRDDGPKRGHSEPTSVKSPSTGERVYDRGVYDEDGPGRANTSGTSTSSKSSYNDLGKDHYDAVSSSGLRSLPI